MKSVFISHSTKDDKVVADIRGALEGKLRVWDDSQYLSGGDSLGRTIETAMDESDYFIALLSLHAVNSPWVRKEIRRALAAGKRIIPVLLPGIEPGALGNWFDDEPVGVIYTTLGESLPALEAALELRLPDQPLQPVEVRSVLHSDLVLELRDPTVDVGDNKRRVKATATLCFIPHDGGRPIESQRYHVSAPLGPIENEELAWYLERYINWPVGIFLGRARRVEEQLPEWGGRLYEMLNVPVARRALEAWKATPAGMEPRFTIKVEKDLVIGSSAERQKDADEAATALFALPWELMHDGKEFLALAARGVVIRRSLPNRHQAPPPATAPPIRVLLVSPRPTDQGYFDHRSSALPLVDALSGLGELAEFHLLSPPTLGALKDELERERYHVVHFDGHGDYDPRSEMGVLFFEDALRQTHRVNANEIAALVKDRRVPLFFLDACQTAVAKEDPSSSVAGKLLVHGVASVAAMSHSVLVETARRFVTAFYQALARGERAGQAMRAGQQALARDPSRGKAFTDELLLKDWFVPVLFQEDQDPQLIRALPPEKLRAVIANRRAAAFGHIPGHPEHGFVGRSRELLKAERTLATERYIMLRGEGGEGKTALSTELARWLIMSRRFQRGAFVPLDQVADCRAVLFELGGQLVPDFFSKIAGDYVDAIRLVKDALAEQKTVIVIDNMESILAPVLAPLDDILALMQDLSQTGETRLIFTSREPVPHPFTGNVLHIGRLQRPEAIRLVGQVLGNNNLMPHAADLVESEREIEGLVDAVACHARALVLLVREVVEAGVGGATSKLQELMRSMEAKHPGERERSLLASVRLSLARLKPETRRIIAPLGVFEGGVSLGSIGMALNVSQEHATAIGEELVGVGLAETPRFGYLRFDPALTTALLDDMTDEEQESARRIWAGTIAALVNFLYAQLFEDAKLALNLVALELPNLLAALEYIEKTETSEEVVGVATNLEALIAPLGRPRTLARVIHVRMSASQYLHEWSHARFSAEAAAVERLIDESRNAEAVDAAMSMLERARAAGPAAYDGAEVDMASGNFFLGRALEMSGAAEQALLYLDEAHRRLQELGQFQRAETALNDRANCLRDLGQYDEAAQIYEGSARRNADRGDIRCVAAGKFQLATVRLLQERYENALEDYSKARGLFSQLGERRMEARAWHQIGMVHDLAGDYVTAETAYQDALKIKVQIGDRADEAMTLNQLGNLYSKIGRLEDAVRFYRQAADVFTGVGDFKNEGQTRNNISRDLISLRRYDEARIEVLRAMACLNGFGSAVEPWKAFDRLADLERSVGNGPEALDAWKRARNFYVGYRRDGGASQAPGRGLFALVETNPSEATRQLTELGAIPDPIPYLQALVRPLQAVLAGSRDPALADDTSLHYADAAELLLLTEILSGGHEPA